jgi:hypothetical protein
MEDEYRTYNKLSDEREKKETDNLKRKMAAEESNFAKTNDRNLREKDAFYADVIQNQNLEHRSVQKELENRLLEDRATSEALRQADQRKADASKERALALADQRKDEALSTAQRVTAETLGQQKTQDGAKISLLEGRLREMETSPDPAFVSPAAEEHIRQQYLDAEGKMGEHERAHHRENMDRLMQEYTKRVEDTVSDKKRGDAALNRQHTLERQLDQRTFRDSLFDVQMDKEQTLLSSAQKHDKERLAADRSHSTLLEKQRREYDEIIGALKEEAFARQHAIRQEADFNIKLTQRELASKQNDLIREYEKRLADQKVDYESQLDEIKSNTQSSLLEKDRMNRRVMDEQVRNYDQRIAQLEAQYKERERISTQNHVEELEKVKRSNALLIQKKS